jgi:hypothetical protein
MTLLRTKLERQDTNNNASSLTPSNMNTATITTCSAKLNAQISLQKSQEYQYLTPVAYSQLPIKKYNQYANFS